jgi:hypothetical protein
MGGKKHFRTAFIIFITFICREVKLILFLKLVYFTEIHCSVLCNSLDLKVYSGCLIHPGQQRIQTTILFVNFKSMNYETESKKEY